MEPKELGNVLKKQAPRLLSKGDAVRPAWSPDGSRIAIGRNSRAGKGTPFLWTIPTAGPPDVGAVPVTSDQKRDFFPAWSGDGRFLYFSSTRGGPMNIWRVRLDSKSGKVLGAPEPVTVPALDAESPNLSRGDGRIAYESQSIRSTLRRLGFDARRDIRIAVLGFFAVLVDRVAIQAAALNKRVKVLEGMLPVCAVCKRVRDERETWHPLEQYLLSQPKEQIRHEVCPDCAAKFGQMLDRR